MVWRLFVRTQSRLKAIYGNVSTVRHGLAKQINPQAQRLLPSFLSAGSQRPEQIPGQNCVSEPSFVKYRGVLIIKEPSLKTLGAPEKLHTVFI